MSAQIEIVNGTLMVVAAGVWRLVLDRAEALALVEAMQAKIGEMAVPEGAEGVDDE